MFVFVELCSYMYTPYKSTTESAWVVLRNTCIRKFGTYYVHVDAQSSVVARVTYDRRVYSGAVHCLGRLVAWVGWDLQQQSTLHIPLAMLHEHDCINSEHYCVCKKSVCVKSVHHSLRQGQGGTGRGQGGTLVQLISHLICEH